MSYDLEFHRQPEAEPPRTTDVLAHFVGRSRYDVNEAQALYHHEATGAYFAFEGEGDEESDGEDASGTGVGWTFWLNLPRPSHFALEAAAELRAFTEALGLLVRDPQDDECVRPFDAARFITSWEAHSVATATELGEDPDSPVLRVPRVQLLRDWAWMNAREEYQHAAPEVFFPSILYLREEAGGRAIPAHLWTNAIPLAWPPSELVVLQKKLGDEYVFRVMSRQGVEAAGVPMVERADFAGIPFSTWVHEPPDVVRNLFEEGVWETALPADGVRFRDAGQA